MYGLETIERMNENAERLQLAKQGYSLAFVGHSAWIDCGELFFAAVELSDRRKIDELKSYSTRFPQRLPPRIVEIVEEKAKEYQPVA